MQNYAGKEFSVETVLEVLLEKIEQNYLKLKEGNFSELKERYLLHLYRRGEEHLYTSQGETFKGTITNVDESGLLLIDTENGLRSFNFKEVQFSSES